MNKIKRMRKPTKRELVGSAGIALSLYMGALAMHQQEGAAKANAAATQFKMERDIAAESGAAGQSNAANDSYVDARAEWKRDLDGVVALGALGAVALGVGLDALGKQAKEDSRERTSRAAPQAPDSFAADDSTQPLVLHPEPAPEDYQFDDSTRRITRLQIPVPRPESTGVAKHRAA